VDSNGHFGAFVSGLKIPFPTNRDRAKQRLVRMRDGKPSEGVGGTADVVAFALSIARRVVRFDPAERRSSTSGWCEADRLVFDMA
jgi:hypothetical protein